MAASLQDAIDADDSLQRAIHAGVQAPRMGATRDRERVAVEGTLDGRPVRLLHLQSGDALWYAVTSPLQPALDLGLAARSIQFTRSLPILCGHDGLDQEYQFDADDEGRLQALLAGEVSARFYRLHSACMNITLDDTTVDVTGGWSSDDPWPAAGVRAAVEMAQLLDGARARVPLPRALGAHGEAFAALAARLHGEHGITPLRASGTLDDQRVAAVARREAARRYCLELSVRHREPLGLGLRITPTGGIVERIAVMLGGQDVRVGEADFDDAFRIRVEAAHEAALVDALDRGTRDLLRAVRGSAAGVEVAVDDEQLVATFRADAPPRALPDAVDVLAEASRRLSRALRIGPQRSAYRG